MKKTTSARVSLLITGVIVGLVAGCGGGGGPSAPAISGDVGAGSGQILVRGGTVQLLDASGAATGHELTIPDVSGYAGETIHVLVNLDDVGGVAGFSAELTFSPTVLETTEGDVQTSPDVLGTRVINVDTPGLVAVAVAGTQPASSGATTLLDIAFTIKPGTVWGTTNLGINAELYDAEAHLIAMASAGGEVSIQMGLLGDIDGDGKATPGDAIHILRMMVGLEDPTALADVDQIEGVTIGDVIKVLRCVVALDPWPIGTLGNRRPTEIVSTTPTDGAIGVDCSVPIIIVFSTEVKSTSLTYTVSPSADFTPTWNAPDNDTVQLDPVTDLAPGTAYTISDIGVTPADTLYYEALSGGQFSFTTLSATQPPTVQITSPIDGATVSGSFDVDVTATAQEPGTTITKIDVTADSTTKTIYGDSGTVTFDVSELSTSRVKASAAPSQAWTVSVANATVSLSPHTITAVATDSLGVTGTDSITVNTSGTATVSVNLSDTSGVAGFQMTINYDPSVLEVVGGDAGVQLGESPAAAGPMLMVNTATAGVITVAVAGVQEFDTTKQEILLIEFQAIGAAGVTNVSIDDTAQAPTPLKISDTTGAAITPVPTAVDGTVTIQ